MILRSRDKSFGLRRMVCINDFAERNIRFIQDFVTGFKSEQMKQNLLLVSRDNRKTMKKLIPKDQLSQILDCFSCENVTNIAKYTFFIFQILQVADLEYLGTFQTYI